jgi:hypothetical protein
MQGFSPGRSKDSNPGRKICASPHNHPIIRLMPLDAVRSADAERTTEIGNILDWIIFHIMQRPNSTGSFIAMFFGRNNYLRCLWKVFADSD